jgi:Protein of unknown function (DUF3570)
LKRLLAGLAGLVGAGGGLVLPQAAQAVDLPPDKAEAMFHVYDGGGVRADGPALLVRKSIAERYSVQASWYVDAVSNASIDVVTTASPFKEKRNQYDFSLDHLVRDGIVSLGYSRSSEPDYNSSNLHLNASQEVFGAMTTVSAGFSRGSDTILKSDSPEFKENLKRWAWRAGLTQVLTPRWIASANFEAISDSGYLSSPYRVARVFGAAVPERAPSTRTSRALKLRVAGDLGSRDAIRGEVRFFNDTWDIKATTFEAGYSRHLGQRWLADGFVRGHSQTKALFYSDNAAEENVYASRNRLLSTFKSTAFGGRISYAWGKVAGDRADLKLVGSLERINFRFRDFTDIRTGTPFRYDATVMQVLASASF